MKSMTCAQLGGPKSCNQEFFAETFEEMVQFSKQHGMEMFQKGEEAHIKVMNEMKKHMDAPDAMKNYTESKRKLFDSIVDVPQNN